MREKYIEERHPRWFAMGGPNSHDIDAPNDFIGSASTPLDRDKIIDDHNALVDAYVSLAQAFDAAAPEAFRKFWYGGGA